MTKAARLEELQRALGYAFNDERELERALVHASTGDDDNEQLEFLGDAALEYAVTVALYEKYGRLSVGELTAIRANLVNNKRLAAIAMSLGIDRRMAIGPSVMANPTKSSKVCADAFEAVIGAVCVDGGMTAVRKLVEQHVLVGLKDAQPSAKHAKSALQEWAAAHKHKAPQYEVSDYVAGKCEETWRVTCRIPGLEHVGTGSASSKREAERLAAKHVLQLVNAS